MLTPNQLRRWQTPLSSAQSVVLTSLTDEGHLNLTFQANSQGENNLICFSFKRPTSYSVKGQLSNSMQQLANDMGNTFLRPPTQWTSAQEPLFNYAAMRLAMCQDEDDCDISPFGLESDHYYFVNQDGLIEVCCSTPPETLLIARQSKPGH